MNTSSIISASILGDFLRDHKLKSRFENSQDSIFAQLITDKLGPN